MRGEYLTGLVAHLFAGLPGERRIRRFLILPIVFSDVVLVVRPWCWFGVLCLFALFPGVRGLWHVVCWARGVVHAFSQGFFWLGVQGDVACDGTSDPGVDVFVYLPDVFVPLGCVRPGWWCRWVRVVLLLSFIIAGEPPDFVKFSGCE